MTIANLLAFFILLPNELKVQGVAKKEVKERRILGNNGVWRKCGEVIIILKHFYNLDKIKRDRNLQIRVKLSTTISSLTAQVDVNLNFPANEFTLQNGASYS